MNPRLLEIIGQLIVGDGITCILVPRRHMLLWRDAFGSQLWRRMVQWFADNQGTTIMVGLAEALAGLWCILRANRGR
jgi:hypothetical protein